MDKKQQTAVEWLYKELTNYISYDDDKAFKQHEDVTDIVNQAKVMEKEQRYNNGHKEMKVVVQVDEDTILNTPNDAALGGIVRNLFYEVKRKQNGKG
jgi:hypothetical protein